MADDDATLLAAGLLNVCKELLGRVRVLEEVVAGHPELEAAYQKQSRFRVAFEEDEYGRITEELRELVSALEGDVPLRPERDTAASAGSDAQAAPGEKG